MSNTFLPERFVEIVHRLAAGVEPTDPVRRARHRAGIAVTLDRPDLPAGLRSPVANAQEWIAQLKKFDRHESCRFALRHGPLVAEPLEIRVFDASGRRRVVSRRLTLPIPTWATVLAAEDDLDDQQLPVAQRTFRPALLPGAGYDIPSGVTALRGSVTLAGEPLRWARVGALRRDAGGNNAVRVGVAHGDDRGEFLLVLDTSKLRPSEVPNPFPIVLRVHGRPPPNTPLAASDFVRGTFPAVPAAEPERSRYLRAHVADPLWDMPMESLAVPDGGGLDVEAGIAIPEDYDRSNSPDIAASAQHGRVNRIGSIEFVP